MAPIAIPQFLLPRGIPSSRTLHALTRRRNPTTLATTVPSLCRCASSDDGSKPRVLAKPDKFRPPSHPARRVVPTRNGRVVSGPINYPGPRLSEKEKAQICFRPRGRSCTSFCRGVLTSLATFTFTTNFKHSSPYAHLLPPWSALLTHPIDTIGQALAVFRMHVQHTSMETREKRLKRVEDAEKRRQYRIAHGLEEPNEKSERQTPEVVDDQSPVAVDIPAVGPDEYVDWEGKKRPVKKWLGIW
ncbi:hypothetical protein KXX57_000019 [Aspergillus fumigatus]|nr:hypothetical protein KXX57_000019 [Aspergillus fumigatus]